MTYDDVIEKLKANEPIDVDGFKGYWFFQLLRDYKVKTVHHESGIYEFNFVPVESFCGMLFIINPETCPDWHAAREIARDMISNYKTGNTITVSMDGKYYRLEIEILESIE